MAYLYQILRSFRTDQSGSVLTFWAMALGVFMGLIALSIDFGRSATTQSELQAYVDNVALAAAGELDSKPDAITRATLAARTFISDTQTFGEGDQTLSDEGDFTLAFYSTPPTPTTAGVPSDDPTLAGYVQVTAVQRNVVAVFGNAFSALTGEDAGGGNVGADAVAGYTQYACDISPLMFCAPNADFRADENVGVSVLLRTGGPNAAWGPGAFGFLDPSAQISVDEDGVCAGLSGANLDICLIGAVGNRTSCFAQSGVDVAGGQRVGNFAAALNVRFDIYHASTNKLRNDPNYPPAPNVRSSWEATKGQCIGQLADLSEDTMGFPPDDCQASGQCGRFGDGDWSQGRQDYIDINFDGTDPFPLATTRYDYYLAEIEAVDVPVIEFVELFMAAPIGLDGSKDVWIEVIGSIGGGSGGGDEEARFREVVQLYR